MADNFEEMIADFESKMKPVTPKAIETGVIEAEAPPPTPEVPAEEGEEPTACLNKEFKKLVGALKPGYIGEDIQDLVVEFLDTLPECKEE